MSDSNERLSGDETFTLEMLDYALPEELIAQEPASDREAARLLVVDRARGVLHDRTVADLPALLNRDDLLVLNDTKVIPARFQCRRATGGLVRGLFLEDLGRGAWRVLLEGSRRLRVSERLRLIGGSEDHESTHLELIESHGNGAWIVRPTSRAPAVVILERFGQTPLPPYIKRGDHGARPEDDPDRERYQTVYARTPGAVAAPTAGLHFTERLLAQLEERGIGRAFVTLHVGLGTFKPITVQRLADHVMHREWFDLPDETVRRVEETKHQGGRVVAVGTTSVRVLETAACGGPGTAGAQRAGPLSAGSGWTDLFIYPPYSFRVVDALLTNFHLPGSTLLALVMAFAGVQLTRHAYEHARRAAYRFYSYGDAMLIL